MEHAANRRRLPETRTGFTKKALACGFKYYVTVNFFDDGLPGEVFIVIAKEGSDTAGWIDALAITISIALQYGVPWDVLKEKYLYTRFGIPSEDGAPSLLHALTESIDEVIQGARERRTDDK